MNISLGYNGAGMVLTRSTYRDSSYLEITNGRRLKRPTGVSNASVKYNANNITLPKPRKFSYEEYVSSARSVMEGEMEVEECGIHEIWLLHELPYAEYIFKTKDLMHSANNIIKDFYTIIST